MDEFALREMVAEVKRGRLSRRRFVQAMLGVGLTAPMANAMLAAGGVAQAQPRSPVFAPTRRGGGGQLKLLYWQAPTILNSHLSTGVKDYAGSRIFCEPLAAYDTDANLVPILAAEVPTLANGGLAKDGLSVTWNLKKGVTWHDGRPFTADDVVFNWEYAADPATAATSIGVYRELERVEKLGDLKVKVVFKQPNPFWNEAFCGSLGLIIPRHAFQPFKGARSREAPANVKPVGTGAYRCLDFKPGDTVRAELFPAYHAANRPFFDTLEMKGGGDAVSAARAVLQTGEYDFAWNMQVEDDILRRMEQGGKGEVIVTPGNGPEHVQCNFTDPWREVDGERSSMKTTHPLLADPAVRQALALLVDRAAVQEQIYGRLAQASANFLNAPPRYHSKNLKWEFSPDKAAQILEAAGWKRGADGIRAKDGRKLKMVFQTSTNAPRQKTQAIIKQAAAKAGIELELKSVVASVYFSSDPANPDTFSHFYADIQMYNTVMSAPDPQRFMEQFCSWQIATKDNKWAGTNKTRFKSDEYDRLWKSAEREMDPVRRAALFIQMNDLIVQQGAIITVVWRHGANAAARTLRGTEISPWDSTLWNLPNWYRQA